MAVVILLSSFLLVHSINFIPPFLFTSEAANPGLFHFLFINTQLKNGTTIFPNKCHLFSCYKVKQEHWAFFFSFHICCWVVNVLHCKQLGCADFPSDTSYNELDVLKFIYIQRKMYKIQQQTDNDLQE